MPLSSEHILVLGATGISGLVFARHVLSLPATDRPELTLYVRNRSKLPDDIQASSFRVVEGGLDNEKALTSATSGVTSVVSFLGAYLSFINVILHRTGPTPIGDAMPTVIAAMRANGVTRVLALSTPSAFPQAGEILNWGWYLKGKLLPTVFAPQGNAEMAEIATQFSKQSDLEWTIYRVPHLNEGDAESEVAAGLLGPEYKGTTELSRGSLGRWILKEIEERRWIRGAPMLGNVWI